jgi:hypothetical protein
MQALTEWTGTASDLLGALAEMAGERVAKSKTWPDSPRALAGRLRRAATFLRKVGIDIGFEREGRARTRTIHITTAAPDSRQARQSASSAPSTDPVKPNVGNGFESRNLRTVGDPADGSPGETAATVRANPLKTNIETDADGADDIRPLHSAPESAGWRARL